MSLPAPDRDPHATSPFPSILSDHRALPDDHRISLQRRFSGSLDASALEMSHLNPREEGDDDDDVGPYQQRDRDGANEDGTAKRASQRRRAGTLTDPELDMTITAENLANKAFIHKAAVNMILISLWYLFSVSISVYNKWMFGDGQLSFKFPIFTTSMHMLVQFGLASLVLFFVPSFRPKRDPNESHDRSKAIVEPWFYLTRIAPCATATGLDIGLGNTSLEYVTLIFFTMCKSSTLGFVLLFAILFRLEKPSLKLAGVILIMTVGVIMMVAGETAFSGIGFTLLMLASLFSGLRWSLTQMLLRRNAATSNPFASLFFLTPIMFFVLFALAIPVEGFGPLFRGFGDLANQRGTLFALVLLVFPGCLAFLMTSAEFALLKRTSVVTLSVCGIFKEVITIAAGGIIFEEKLTPINISGVFVTILAIAAYNYMRIMKMKDKTRQKAQDEVVDHGEEHAPMLAEQEGGEEDGPAASAELRGDEVARSSLTEARHSTPHI